MRAPGTSPLAVWLPRILGMCLTVWANGSTAWAYSPESPEVQRLIAPALDMLGKHQDERLGCRCLVGLVFVKADQPEHPKVQEALKACRDVASRKETIIDAEAVYTYGLAVIFLCNLDAKAHHDLIRYYMAELGKRQKPFGAWGYPDNLYTTGDTSQTQYGALAAWEAHMKGIAIAGLNIDAMANWITATQAPDGGWGYQGKIAPSDTRVAQSEVTCSMVSAAMGSLYIAADLYGLSGAKAADSAGQVAGELPAALRVAEDPSTRRAPKLRSSTLNARKLFDATRLGEEWMTKHYTVENLLHRESPEATKDQRFTHYYMYGLERYRSFQELLDGRASEEPEWYNKGVEYLAKSQSNDGSWESGCGAVPDTAFAILFLLRSAQKSIRASLGDGLAIGGRGLPNNLANLKVKNGRLVVEQTRTEVGSLLAMLDDNKLADLDAMIDDPQAITGKVDANSARRLTQMVRDKSASARLIAVRALGQTGSLDHAPTLIYALTDPDPQVVLAARDGLCFIARRFDDFGPPDTFDRAQQAEAVNRWKAWFESIRPGVPVLTE